MKVRRLSENQLSFDFYSSQLKKEIYFDKFLESDLGFLYQSIPWAELVSAFNLKEHNKGPDCVFPPEGKIALMFLKPYSGMSDNQLLSHINGSQHYQFFCGIQIDPEHPLENFKIISQIRCELAQNFPMDTVQESLAHHWLPYLDDPDKIVMDATCYESYIRYPTDVKLLFESVSWLRNWLKKLNKLTGVRMPRSKFRKWRKRYANYSKSKRKSRKERKKLTKALLLLLDKFLIHTADLVPGYACKLQPRQLKRYATIQKIKEQQWTYFFEGQAIKNRIVSIDQPHLRPIVRGKETKKVEFGVKVNNFQIDGISFIDKLSFDNFNESTRFKSAIFKAQKLTGKKVKVVGGDAIYATNANRSFASKNRIKTDFKPKGPPLKDPEKNKQRKQLKAMITKERASRMEGSFGTEKEHYTLTKIPTRTKKSEILFIFFGIHTANSVRIGKRIKLAKQAKKRILPKAA